MHLSSQCRGMGKRYSFPHTTQRMTKVWKDEATFLQPPRLSGLGKEPSPVYRLVSQPQAPLQTKPQNTKTCSLVVFSVKAGSTELAPPVCSASRKSAQVQGQDKTTPEHHNSILQLHQLWTNLSFAVPGHRNSSSCPRDGR